jgi:hypothetical protein
MGKVEGLSTISVFRQLFVSFRVWTQFYTPSITRVYDVKVP